MPDPTRRPPVLAAPCLGHTRPRSGAHPHGVALLFAVGHRHEAAFSPLRGDHVRHRRRPCRSKHIVAVGLQTQDGCAQCQRRTSSGGPRRRERRNTTEHEDHPAERFGSASAMRGDRRAERQRRAGSTPAPALTSTPALTSAPALTPTLTSTAAHTPSHRHPLPTQSSSAAPAVRPTSTDYRAQPSRTKPSRRSLISRAKA